jgi:hypothetical protein
LKKKGYDIRQYLPELWAFYNGMEPEGDASDQKWKDRQKVFEEWAAAIPNSLTARVAEVNWYIYYAWKVQGGGYADANTVRGDDTMTSCMAHATDILNSVPPGTVIDDPMYYDDWIDICLVQSRPEADMFGYLKKGTDTAKECQCLYITAATYLLERWSGAPGEREKWMKTWADGFPPESGGIFYAYLAADDGRFIGEDIFKRHVDYHRAKVALQQRLRENDPDKWSDENVLSYLAVLKHDDGLAGKLLLDLEGSLDYGYYSTYSDDGQTYYAFLRNEYGVQAAMNKVRALERSGKSSEAERLLRSYTTDPLTYEPLEEFYERQGMEDKLMLMNYKVIDKTPKEMEGTEIATAEPEYLAELASLYPMVGKWNQAELVASTFDKERPANLIGKNILLLCAIERRDAAAEQAVIKEIATLKTDRPVYQAAQSVVSGTETWEQAGGSKVLKKKDPYLSQGITSITLYYLAKGRNDEARKVIEQSLPHCTVNSGKILLQSLDFGSLAHLLQPVATPKPTASPSVSPH